MSQSTIWMPPKRKTEYMLTFPIHGEVVSKPDNDERWNLHSVASYVNGIGFVWVRVVDDVPT